MLRKRLVILLVLVSLAIGCRQLVERSLNKVQGNGKITTETRNLSGFTSLDVSGGLIVNVVCQQAAQVEVTADENLLVFLKTEVHNGTLKIFPEGGQVSFTKPVQITVSVPELRNLDASGACRVNLSQAKTDELAVELNGASRLQATGTARTLKANVNGASRLDAKELQTARVSVEANGASNATVFASEAIDANANGASSISYYGHPAQVKPEANGGSRVSAGD